MIVFLPPGRRAVNFFAGGRILFSLFFLSPQTLLRPMEESKRQKQVAGLIQAEMNDIFNRVGLGVVDGGLLSISRVALTPDLLEARIYLSFFQIKNPAELLQSIRERTGELRLELGKRVRNQLRRVPELQFFTDDTLDHVFKMEELFKKIEDERKQ